jgi:hypothetical protein
MSGKAAAKEERERREFAFFVKAIRSWSSISDVRSQPQDFADLKVKRDGEEVGFELLSIVDEDLAKRKNSGVHFPDFADVYEKVSAKLNNDYLDSGPVELLIYSKLTGHPTEVVLHHSQKALWADGLGQFRRVWFLSEDNRVFLFHKSWWSEIGLLPNSFS